jgi:hypothetical protein
MKSLWPSVFGRARMWQNILKIVRVRLCESVANYCLT